MSDLKKILKDLPKRGAAGDESDIMSDPDYVRQSSKFISDSLRKGHDVLQLENGDVITTVTKTITTQFTWDGKKKKMVKTTAKKSRPNSDSE